MRTTNIWKTAIALVVASFFLFSLNGCGGGGGVRPDPEDPPDPPPEECPEGQVGTPPNCEDPSPPEPRTLNEQHRSDAGLSKIPPNGVWPSNHRAIVKPKFAVIEVTSDRVHGRDVQAAACAGYAPGGCTVDLSDGGEIRGVTNAPFIFIEPRPGEGLGGVFQPHELAARVREHPDLVIASMSAFPVLVEEIAALTQEGIASVWSAGNEGTVNWRDTHPWLWDEEENAENPDWDGVLDGDKLLQHIASDEVLLVAGYERVNGRFVPDGDTTQCEGIDSGCIYAPMHFEYGGEEPEVGTSGTSFSAPFVAAGLASVLAVFPETSGGDLIRLAKRCAVSEPGLTNGLGRFSLSCMDNSEVFYLDQVGEESMEGMSARAQGIAAAFASAPLPGDSAYVAEVEGVSLTRNMEGSFSHRSGVTTVPGYQGVDEDDSSMRVNLFYDYGNSAPGIRVGNKDVFLAASWSNESSFFGYEQYQAQSLNVSAGTEHLYLRMSEQKGDTTGYGVIDDVEGSSIGATLTRTFTTSLGEITPFLNMDKFTGGEATTPFGSMQIKGSEWNHELGLRTRQQVSEHGSLQVTATAQHRGDSDRKDYSVQAQYGLRF